MDILNREKAVQQINKAIEESEQGLERYYLTLKEKNARDPNPDREEVLKEYNEYYRSILDCKRGQETMLESIVEHINEKGHNKTGTSKREDEMELQRLKRELETVRNKIRTVTDLIY